MTDFDSNNALVGEFDAQRWAEGWMVVMAEKPEIAHDEGAMLAWFATALMAGYDRGRADEQKRDLGEKVREIVYQAAGAATRPLLEDHPDYVFPSREWPRRSATCASSSGSPTIRRRRLDRARDQPSRDALRGGRAHEARDREARRVRQVERLAAAQVHGPRDRPPAPALQGGGAVSTQVSAWRVVEIRLKRGRWKLVTPGMDGLGAWQHRARGLGLIHSVGDRAGRRAVGAHLDLARRRGDARLGAGPRRLP